VGMAPMTVTIRRIEPTDVPAVVEMVHELAAFERSPLECHLTEAQLRSALFARTPALFGHLAEVAHEPVGFALWFLNFSTWRGVHGIYLEDLYVRPTARGGGVGQALLATLAAICAERGYERLEWWVLEWNPARRFYDAIGATPMHEWVPYRLTGEPLRSLAALVPPAAEKAVESLAKGDAGVTRVIPEPSAADEVVLLEVPAAGAYLGVLRTATAGLAARLQFTLDEIEDLRIAVDEACAMLLVLADPDAELSCRFTITDDALSVETSVPTVAPNSRLPAGESFSWQVLSALADEVQAEFDGRRAMIRLTKRRPFGAAVSDRRF
jgi:GNAT superfamily N-acetyltransferase